MNHLQRMKQFKDIFGFPLPIDGLVTILKAPGCPQPSIDIIKFETLLKNNGYNTHSNVSISSFIIKKYGKEAHELVKSFL